MATVFSSARLLQRRLCGCCICIAIAVMTVLSTLDVSALQVSPSVIKEGSSEGVVLKCPFSTEDCKCDNIMWYKNDMALDVKLLRYTVTASHSIVRISNVHLNDTGLYKCQAIKDGEIIMDSKNQLRVQALPVITIRPHASRIAVGGSVTLRCAAHSAFLVLWRHRGRRIVGHMSRETVMSAHGTIINVKSTITIRDIQREDAGTYTCEAFIQVGESNRTTSVIVEYGPSVNITSSKRGVVPSGHHVVLKCHVDAEPKAAVEWQYNGTLLASNTTKLSLDNVQVEQSGIYECHASNYLNTSISSIHLTVQDPIRIHALAAHQTVRLGDPLRLSTNISQGNPKISWFKNGNKINFKEDTHYKMDTTGSLLTVAAAREDNATFKYRIHYFDVTLIQEYVVTVLYPPSVVRNLELHINDSTPGTVWVNVSWQKPSEDGNSPLSAYRIAKHRSFASTAPDHVKLVELTSHQLWLNVAIRETGSWTFSVQALNKAGFSSSAVSTKNYHVIVQSVHVPQPTPSSLPFRLLLLKTQCSDVTSHVTREKVREKVVNIINSLSPELHVPVDDLRLVDFERYNGEGIALLASLSYNRDSAADMELIGSMLSAWVQNQSDNRPFSVSGVSMTVSRRCPTLVDNNNEVERSHLCPLSWNSGVLDCSESVASNGDDLETVTIVVAGVLCFVIVLLVVAICVVKWNQSNRQNRRAVRDIPKREMIKQALHHQSSGRSVGANRHAQCTNDGLNVATANGHIPATATLPQSDLLGPSYQTVV